MSQQGAGDRQLALRAEFEQVRGYWSPLWDSVLRLDPDYFEAYLRFSEVPWLTGSLPPKVKELVYIAVDAVTTHLYEPGLRIHVRNALALGASEAEIMEVLELCTLIGLESGPFGAALLLDEAEALGLATDAAAADNGSLGALGLAFEERYGGWSPGQRALAAIDPDYVARTLALVEAASSSGVLDEATVQLVLLAANASVTHADPARARVHVRRALLAGASVRDVLEVLQLAAVLGVHTLVIGVPILVDEVAQRAR